MQKPAVLLLIKATTTVNAMRIQMLDANVATPRSLCTSPTFLPTLCNSGSNVPRPRMQKFQVELGQPLRPPPYMWMFCGLASGVVMPGGVLGSILAPAVFAVRLLSVSLATSRCEVASFYLGRQLFAGTWSPFTLRPRSRSSSRTFCCIASSVRFMTQRK